MSNAAFGWESLLDPDVPDACALRRALFTTYARPDARFLAEHLLPCFLKLGREAEAEGEERQHFLVELDSRLKQLHGRLVVVSSTAREEPGEAGEGPGGPYGWIWRSVRHLTVGSRGKAVQHAKLWLLHWGPAPAGGAGYLGIVVSSANLTRAAFQGQLQAAWRACVHLHPRPSAARLARWGLLPEFLRELASSAGEDGHFDPFIEFLARGDCPEGVSFVASVPGRHSRQVVRRTPWGTAGLREITPAGRGKVSVGILTPFVGSWGAEALRHWCAAFGGSPSRLALVWIDEDHRWARDRKWLLPEVTLKTLAGLGATLLKLRCEPDRPEETDLFHEDQRPADDRWGHAKVYSFRRGASRRLLVTSANFSPAAWGRQDGDGGLIIENFELGVCVAQAAWPFDALEAFDNPQEAATVPASALRSPGSALILWARAVWDGTKVTIACRCAAGHELQGTLQAGVKRFPITNWTFDADRVLRSAEIPWKDADRPPLLVQLACGKERASFPVFDARPPRDREGTLPPEVDQDAGQRIRDKLLFELYGGRVAEDAAGEEPAGGGGSGAEGEGGPGARPDSYSLPAFELARRHLSVVDTWAEQASRTGTRDTEAFDRELLLRDGELLIEAFRRQAIRDGKKGPAWAIGATLAAEELTVRLKHFRKA